MIGIKNLQHLRDKLADIDLGPAQKDALGHEAERLEASVHELLSRRPGSDHSTPWLRTGGLRDSIKTEASADEAVIASTSPVAVYQEHGTSTVPPRPFLAPAGAAGAEEAAIRIGRAIADAIRDAIR